MKNEKLKIKNGWWGSYALRPLGPNSHNGWWGILLLLLLPLQAWAEGSDSVRVIGEVTVRSRMLYHETIQPQTLDHNTLSHVNAKTVADAMRLMGGVQLKDYGGIGGLKTVNLRSMGSQHLGIYYDGVELGNAQNGVIDLGQFSLDNVEEVSLYQGQRSSVMQTASDIANAGSIYIRTQRPRFTHPTTRLKLQYGSSSTLRLSALHTRTLTHDIAMNINVEGLSSSGKYDFTYRRRNLDGTLAYDTTATRQNGDIQALRSEANLYGRIGHGQWQAKLYTYHANRGIPGAIVNNVWRRGERQSDDNTMAQASWQKDLCPTATLRIQGKYASYRTHYINKDSTQLQVDNTYRQQEAYANVTQVVELRPWWSMSLSYDARWNHLDADVPLFAHPQRWTHLLAAATALDIDSLKLQASVVWSHVKDHTTLGPTSQPITRWTPALFVSYDATRWLQLTAYAKRSFRMPTFNDLYYTGMGNALLRPETATQYAIGIGLKGTTGSLSGQLHIDAYHNDVRDKIVAYPKGQQFRWTMLNLGQVAIDGIDLRMDGHWTEAHGWQLTALVQYTWQQALDVTDSHTSYYRHQIPYTPHHSGSLTLMAERGRWAMAYNLAYTGERYCQQENIPYNHLEPWYTCDAHLSLHLGRHKLTLEVCNLLDQQYDVIINYPMPGRNYNLTWLYAF